VVWRFASAAAGFSQRFSRKKHTGSSLARAGMGDNLYSYSLEPALACNF
jgi:hypothetical protein